MHSTNLINFDFLDHRLFAIRKFRGIINHPMLRVYYLPSEELTFTPKLRENLVNKTYVNGTQTNRILSIKTVFQLLMCFFPYPSIPPPF